jgi:hypothetical protein
VDYSPLTVESIVEVLVKEERRLEAILAAVPPSNLSPRKAYSLFVSLFLISAFVRRENKYLKEYIEGFRSTRMGLHALQPRQWRSLKIKTWWS